MIKGTETTWSNLSETIAILGISDRTLRRYAASNRIKTLKIGRQLFYDVESYQEEQLEAATEADTLVKTSFVAVVYDSRKNPDNTIPGLRTICRPSFTAMIPGGVQQLYDGSFGKVWKTATFCVGSNLDFRMPAGSGLILSEDWNAIAIQGAIGRLIEAGELQVFLPVAEEFGASFRAYSQDDALSLVKQCYEFLSLERYALNEDRRVVRAAIEDKREEISKAVTRGRNLGINDTDSDRNYRGAA
ncbi:helix-turn-helix domain-containing protein [Synechocystis sp. PCC 7509]|uniref:helix-turn-helix domain-containing protein n=1 Tax=Synechocystis sp. PCC 7509 TaxID=927677 RepID=UPI0002ABA854|nr:helix-turn-helix domain-containing protein [Synechocystis sp. PCC 7509]